jgi:hypothetical protein
MDTEQSVSSSSDRSFFVFSAKTRSEFSRAAYLAAVAVTAEHVLKCAIDIIPSELEGERFHDELNDVLIEVALYDDETVREVLAFSPNLNEVHLSDIGEAVEMAKLTPNKMEATANCLGQIAYKAFEQDLWGAIWPIYKARFYGTSPIWTAWFTDNAEEMEK